MFILSTIISPIYFFFIFNSLQQNLKSYFLKNYSMKYMKKYISIEKCLKNTGTPKKTNSPSLAFGESCSTEFVLNYYHVKLKTACSSQ